MKISGSVRQARLRRGFTFLELAVIMVIIGILIALLLPSVQWSREQARKTQCRSNLKQLSLAVLEYLETRSQFPFNGSLSVRLVGTNEVKVENAQSFLPPLMDYLDSNTFSYRFRWDKPAFDSENASLVIMPIPTFRCPVSPQGDVNSYSMPKGTVVYAPFRTAKEYATTYGTTDYIVHSGVTERFRKGVYQKAGGIPKNGVGAIGPIRIYPDAALTKALGNLPANENVSKKDVTDGEANTLLISECAGRNELWRMRRRISEKQDAAASARQKMMGGGGWADPFNQAWINGRQADGAGTSGPCAINCSNEPDAGLYSFHRGGAHVALVDGSVRFLNEKLSPVILGRLVMRADGEKIDGEF